MTSTFDVNLPFTFRFYDGDYTSVSVGAPGAIAFPSGQTVPISAQALGTAGSPNALIAAFWENLELLTSNNGFLGTSVTGTSPNREFCIEWNNFNQEFTNASRLTFKIVLYEGAAGAFDVVYAPPTGTSATYSATAGMEDVMGRTPIEFANPTCSPNCVHQDLVNLGGNRLSFTRDAGPEVFAADIRNPEFGFLGATQPLPVTIGSLHGNPLGPFEVQVYVADNPMMTDAVLAGSRTVSLTAYQQLDTEVEVTPPVSLGETRVWFELRVDTGNDIMEAAENNNTLVSRTGTLLLPGAPDLDAARVTTRRLAEYTVGQPFDVFVTVRNIGSDPVSQVDAAVMLSTNPAVSRFDLQLDRITVDLAPGESSSATVAVTLPMGLNSGEYYLGLLADPDQTVQELSESNNVRVYFQTITVVGTQLGITTNALPAGVVFEPYLGLLTAVGGTPPLTWAVTDGALPAGVGLVPDTGELFGRPAMEEQQTFTVEVTDATGATDSVELTLRVVDPQLPLTIVTQSLPPAVVGQEYAFPLVLAGPGAEAEDLAWTSEDLPEELSITDDGILVGAFEAPGDFSFTVQAATSEETATRTLSLEVADNVRLLIAPTALSTGQFGEAYSAQLEATGGLPPYTWLVNSGELPDGLSLGTDGSLTGTPDEVGDFRFVVEVRDSGVGEVARDVEAFRLRVTDDGAFSISTAELPVGTVGRLYDATVGTTGGRPPFDWRILEGRLPDGILLNNETGLVELRIVGQVDDPSANNLLLEVTDAQGRTAQRALLLRFEEAAVMNPGPIEMSDGGCDATAGGSSAAWGWAIAALGLGLVRRRRR